MTETDEDILLSPFVLAECDYMLTTRLGNAAAREFLVEVVSGAYQLVVIAARYQTTRVLTFDHRHFRAVAPLWGAPAFTLLPTEDA